MADNTVEWSGKSGTEYTFSVFELSWVPKADQDGNYIFAKVVNDYFQAIYIGQGDIKDRKDNHLREGCVAKKGATHYLCHLNTNRDNRLYEESDILANHQEAYVPSGCNVETGG